MFRSSRVDHPGGFIEYRRELATGLRSRICPERLRRNLNQQIFITYSPEGCPFCPENIGKETPTFPDGSRMVRGESTTFPNLYPFASYHVVTVLSHQHQVREFSQQQIMDALSAQVEVLRKQRGYASINWNNLPSAGASLPHPHIQGLVEQGPDTLLEKYLSAGKAYYAEKKRSYWDDLIAYEQGGPRLLSGTRLFWYANPVPLGEREVRCILPVRMISEFPEYIPDFSADLVRILRMFRELGTFSWNLSLFFADAGDADYFSAFCTLISRINPNPLSASDTAFMERLHLEPVILTLPEDLSRYWDEFLQSH